MDLASSWLLRVNFLKRFLILVQSWIVSESESLVVFEVPVVESLFYLFFSFSSSSLVIDSSSFSGKYYSTTFSVATSKGFITLSLMMENPGKLKPLYFSSFYSFF